MAFISGFVPDHSGVPAVESHHTSLLSKGHPHGLFTHQDTQTLGAVKRIPTVAVQLHPPGIRFRRVTRDLPGTVNGMHTQNGPIYNPFSPNLPVAPHLLAGRAEALAQIEAALSATASGKPTHVLIISEPWLGKTSFALRAERLAHCLGDNDSCLGDDGGRVMPVFCSMGACTSLIQVCATIINEALRNLDAPRGSLISRLLRRINGLRLGPLGIDFESAKDVKVSAVSAFPHILEDILAGSDAGYTCRHTIALLLDEVHNIARIDGVASLIKTSIEHLSRRGRSNVMFLMTADPADIESISSQDDSFARTFSSIRIGLLTEFEVQKLLTETARRGRPSKAFTDDAMEFAAGLAAGYPGFVQQIGHAAFELSPGPLIDLSVVKKALFGTRRVKGALASVADKHFRHLLDLQPLCARILDTIDRANSPLTAAEIKKATPGVKNLGPSIRKLTNRTAGRKLGPRSRPSYAIAAPIVSLWLHLQRTLPQRALRRASYPEYPAMLKGV